MTLMDMSTTPLDALCPMHAVLNSTGHIVHAGPTLEKLHSSGPIVGRRFFDLFELRRPRSGMGFDDLRRLSGRKLHLRLRDGPRTELKGMLVDVPEGSAIDPAGGMIINLSFGISVVDAVRDFKLTNGDFAPTDLTIEMLYLIEAKSAAMEASRTLNLRLQGAKIAAEEQAFTDTLTGLKNRRALDHVLERLSGSDLDFGLMHLDLDFFKAVNDTLGHAAGDHVLQQVARILVDNTRRDDTVARVGGDEFVLVLNRLVDRDRLSEIARRIIGQLETPVPFQGEMCRISGSVGIVTSSDYDPPDIALMMEDADLALYASKNSGRARHRFFDPTMRHAAE